MIRYSKACPPLPQIEKSTPIHRSPCLGDLGHVRDLSRVSWEPGIAGASETWELGGFDDKTGSLVVALTLEASGWPRRLSGASRGASGGGRARETSCDIQTEENWLNWPSIRSIGSIGQKNGWSTVSTDKLPARGNSVNAGLGFL